MGKYLIVTILLCLNLQAQVWSWPQAQDRYSYVPFPGVARWFYSAPTGESGNMVKEVGVHTVRSGTWISFESNNLYPAKIRGTTAATTGSTVTIISYGMGAIDGVNRLSVAAGLAYYDYERFWIANGGGDFGPEDNPAAFRTMAFRYSTSAGDSTYKCYASNGSASTIVNTGVSPSGNPTVFDIRRNGSRADYFIDGVLRCTITANLPSGSVSSPKIYLRTLADVDRSVDVYWIYGEVQNK